MSIGGGIAALVLLGGLPLAFAIRRRLDKRFVDTIPGLTPLPGQEFREEYVSLLAPDGTVVQFSPPKGVSPAEAGVLLERKPDAKHATATLLDLAARGYVKISETDDLAPGQPRQWTLVALRGPDPSLRPHEDAFMRGLFGAGPTVTLAMDSANPQLATAHRAVNAQLMKTVVERNWFPPGGTGGAGCACLGLVAGGFLVMFFLISIPTVLGQFGLGFLGVGIVLGFLLAIASLFVRRGRTAAGEAVAQQVRGFRQYLEVAEAGRLRFEEGIDIFSRYLPWAVTFGIASKWAYLCEQLAREGRIPASPSWYESSRPWSYSSYDATLGGLGVAAAASTTPSSSAFSGSSSSSSGDSGFSSSSSSGDGGGGGGGGSW